ncbi:MAG: hypothetical protein ACRD1L_01760, partial [Terriglobales bacterium]
RFTPWVLSAALAAGAGLARAQAQTRVPEAAAESAQQGTAVAAQLQVALDALHNAFSGLDTDSLHLSDKQKQAMYDSQTSIQRNLSDALPALLTAYRAAPDNLGAAFRLYRDVDAVLMVAQQSAATLGSRDSDDRDTLASSSSDLEAALKRLGNWIESEGNAAYTARKPHAAAGAGRKPAASATPPPLQSPSSTPPATLVIKDANDGPTAPAAKKKVPPPTIPH